jgi:hypothetical protein
VRRRTEGMTCPAVDWLFQVSPEILGGPSGAIKVASFGGLPASHSWVRYARKSAAVTESTRQLHTSASAAPISAAVLGPNLVVRRRIGRVWGSGLAHGPLGAPGERQDDEERGKPSLPVHPFSPRRPIRRAHQP